MKRALAALAALAGALALLLAFEVYWAGRGAPGPYENPDGAPFPCEGGGTEPGRVLLVLGDSTAAGQGAPYDFGIAMNAGIHLAERGPVGLINLGVSGARMADVLRDQLPRARSVVPDVVLIAAGANDVVHLSGRDEVMAAQRALLRALEEKNCKVKIVITGSAEMGSTTRFLWPLNALAHARTAWLNEGFRALAAEEQVTMAPIADEVGPRFTADPTLFSADRYHPNERGYALWNQTLRRALDAPQPSHCK